jgi:hypothetical protein
MVLLIGVTEPIQGLVGKVERSNYDYSKLKRKEKERKSILQCGLDIAQSCLRVLRDAAASLSTLLVNILWSRLHVIARDRQASQS